MNKRLRESIKLASKKCKDAQLAVNEIVKQLTFSGFNGEEPYVHVADGVEIYLVWRDCKMSIHEAVERMEEYGYINRGDFE